MSTALVPIDPKTLELIHSSFGKEGRLQPFAREIMLIECHIAGTGYANVKEIEPDLLADAILVLKRETDNPHDPLAIVICDEKGRKLGYVPRVKNEALARLMDAGKLIFARLLSKEWHADWLRVEARVFLRDL